MSEPKTSSTTAEVPDFVSAGTMVDANLGSIPILCCTRCAALIQDDSHSAYMHNKSHASGNPPSEVPGA